MNFSLQTLRQSTAEILAYAVTDLFPQAKMIEGEGTDFGFYYDFSLPQQLDEQAISFIEERMRALIKQNLPIRSLEMMRENAANLFLRRKQDIKAEVVSGSINNIVPIIQIGDFYDYCNPPYIASTNEISAFKIIKIELTSAYLPEKGTISVTRIYGTAFYDLPSLKKSLKTAETTKKRDHRLLGKEMNLFSAKDEVGAGCWLWHPKGTTLRETLIDWWRTEHQQQHFQFLTSPNIAKASLMEKSGLFGHRFHENPLPVFSLDGADYTWRAALAPFHALIFKSLQHSYRQLPIRFAECAEMFTAKKDSQLWGILRARTFTADIGHLFCTPKQVVDELISSLQFIEKISKILGFEYHWYLGRRGLKYAGTLSNWEQSLAWIEKALAACGFEYTVDPFEGARFGPFIEARLVDSLGREWQGPQISIDLNSPERYVLRYQDSDGEMRPPVMIARSLFRSLERLIAILIEHYGGVFPLWLAPEQIRVIPVAERNMAHAEKICSSMEQAGLRVSVDYRLDQLGSKIHGAESEKVPYMIIVGDKEEKSNKLTVRSLYREEIQESFDLNQFLAIVQEEVMMKTLPWPQKN